MHWTLDLFTKWEKLNILFKINHTDSMPEIHRGVKRFQESLWKMKQIIESKNKIDLSFSETLSPYSPFCLHGTPSFKIKIWVFFSTADSSDSCELLFSKVMIFSWVACCYIKGFIGGFKVERKLSYQYTMPSYK